MDGGSNRAIHKLDGDGRAGRGEVVLQGGGRKGDGSVMGGATRFIYVVGG